MKPPNFRITKVECCYTCLKSIHDDELLECPYYYSYTNYRKTKTHYGISVIGKCDRYERRKNIDFAPHMQMNDNIVYPKELEK